MFSRLSRLALPTLASALAAVALACCAKAPTTPEVVDFSDTPDTATFVAAARAAGLVRVSFPAPDPGIPAYARIGAPLKQIFHDTQWLVIPFYRDPNAIRADFDLLTLFDFPGPNGPRAFGVPSTVSGFSMIEPNAPLGTFPQLAVSTGSAVPIWFVNWSSANAALADNVFTMAELRALSPVKGVATTFNEVLRPRSGEHLVVLNARGTTTDGRAFTVHIRHVEDRTTALGISLR